MTQKNSETRKTLSRSLMAAAVVAVAGLTGCASLMSGGSPEQIIEKRSAAYWQARFSGDVAKAYSYMTPGYRALNDQRKYALSYGAAPNLRDPQLISVECAEADGQAKDSVQRCVLRKEFSTQMPLIGQGAIPIAMSETWIKEDGQWWLFQQ